MAVKILFVDDHPSQILGYKTILTYNNRNLDIEATECYNCKDAFSIITDTVNPPNFDLVFLDRSMPAYEEGDIFSGEDLAVLLKKNYPDTKIVILTSHAESFIIYDIVKKVNPTGLLIKSDFSGEELLSAFDRILDGATYHSETVRKAIKELLSREDYLDSINRQIIMLISQGFKTKTIAGEINLTESAVEKRKAKIKDYFCIDKGNDEDIIREAKKLGFI
ncbi:response regulator receiver protein [Flavobacterium saliperosum S13]|uniref:DNA-binding response regulator, NarL/FixJ family, contains REC and HTH domains n=2 Tax=Flavobacterium saliperosum TaxID=329186 RepID=A0A1G4W4Q7_9FLAO|nr:response regulator [Flavobacterium saliperosum]ESU21483.1 response regulator receiver protein [Flavobacterium saliperosum S13]SCX16661.1 DNA-binding response regulator, NarL/FixJ family, contains REC and HTH domains [Flavobacterium saliperosum]